MKLKLFCFPFAGASANIFQKWKSHINPGIELVAVEYPGHGKRLAENLDDNMPDLMNDLYTRISAEIDAAPFAFFGHSIGALVAFELCYRLQKHHKKLPVNIFYSGHVAPHYTKMKKVIFDLPDDEFIKEIISYGGTDSEIFESEELKEFFLPILRADLKLADTYAVEDSSVKLNTDFDIFYSKGDFLLCEEGIATWKECTSQECRIFTIEGDHMYLLNKEKEIVTYINRILSNYL
jgi:surfactin synthase thioesterase subunit